MYYNITNLGTVKILLGTVALLPRSTTRITEEYATRHWEVLEALELASKVTVESMGTDPAIEPDTAVDMGAERERLVVSFSGHVIGSNPIEVSHERGKYPIVQLVRDLGGDSYQIMPDENGTGGYSESGHNFDVVHPDPDTTHVYTNVAAGYIILLF